MMALRRAERWLALAVAAWMMALTLAGCAGDPPARETQVDVAPVEVRQPPGEWVVVYDARLDMDVANAESAATQAARLAEQRGGYLVASQRWSEGSRAFATVTLAVPSDQFDTLRRALLGLGTLASETILSELVADNPAWGNRARFSQITVAFRPSPSAPPIVVAPPISVAPPGWSPARTFQSAFSVFASIFAFLLDALIWIVVVFGPFALLGLGAWALARRLRRS